MFKLHKKSSTPESRMYWSSKNHHSYLLMTGKGNGIASINTHSADEIAFGTINNRYFASKKSWTIRLTCTWHRAKIIINPFLVQIEPIWERFLFLSRNTILLGFWYYIYSQHYRQSGESDYSVLYTKGYPSRRSSKLKKMTRNISFPGPCSCINGDVLP